MPSARRLLAILTAAAVALAPVGAAAAGAHGLGVHDSHAHDHEAKPADHGSQAHHHHPHHHHGAMAKADGDAAEPCGDKTAHTCCCDDDTACTQTCLAKCAGQLAVVAAERPGRAALTQEFATLPMERPPDWSRAPSPPPPRT